MNNTLSLLTLPATYAAALSPSMLRNSASSLIAIGEITGVKPFSNNDLINSLTSSNDVKLDSIFEKINSNGKGVVVFINQTQNSNNLLLRLNELKSSQDKGIVKVSPPIMDDKDFGIGAQILHNLNIHKIELLTNSTQIKRVGMIGYGLEIVKYIKY